MRLSRLFLALCALALAAGPAEAAGKKAAPTAKTVPLGKVIHWHRDRDGQNAVYRVGAYTLRMRSDEALAPILTATSPSGRKTTIEGNQWSSDPQAWIAVARLDPKSPAPTILFATYTGGAHCCTDVEAAIPTPHGWRVAHVDTFDGDPDLYLLDIDRDGTMELESNDFRFAPFAHFYAEQGMPDQIFAVRNGRPAEVSGELRYRVYMRKSVGEWKTGCQRPNGSGCAGYVAVSAKTGQFDRAWSVMLKAMDKTFAFPDRRCDDQIAWSKPCPAGHEHEVPDYPTALHLALIQYGYLPKGHRLPVDDSSAH